MGERKEQKEGNKILLYSADTISMDKISTDCVITVLWNPPKAFNVHKRVLVKCSPVFKRMFETDMKKSKTGIVEITGIDPRIMKLALKYMYGCKFNEVISFDDITDLSIVADRYQIIELKEDCFYYNLMHLVHKVEMEKSRRQFFSNAMSIM